MTITHLLLYLYYSEKFVTLNTSISNPVLEKHIVAYYVVFRIRVKIELVHRDLPNVPFSRNMFLEGSLIFGGFGVPLFKGEQGR